MTKIGDCNFSRISVTLCSCLREVSGIRILFCGVPPMKVSRCEKSFDPEASNAIFDELEEKRFSIDERLQAFKFSESMNE